MPNLATTRMSSKGQVVIPEEIRKKLGLKPGSQFVVIGEKDTVIFKSISMPKKEEFDDLLKKIRTEAKKTGLKKQDISKAIKKYRSQS